MKITHLTTLKHKLQWLLLLTALLGVSQDVWGATRTFASGDKIYLTNQSFGSTTWVSNDAWIHMWGGDAGDKDYTFTCVSGTAGEVGAIYAAEITIGGTYANYIVTRNNSSSSGPWDKKWDQTGDCTLPSSGNRITNIQKDCASITWDTYTPCTAPTAGTAYVQDGSGNWGSSLDIYGSSTVNLKVTGYDVGSSIQWQYSTDNSTWNDCSGKTSAEVSITGVDATTYYRAQVELDNCTAETSAVTVTRKYRIKVKKTSILENSAYIYIWDSSCSAGKWPGTQMMSLDDNWWYAVFDCNPAKIIFNNSSSQTVDVIDRSHDCYEVKGQSNDKYLCDAIDCPLPCSGTVNPGDISITVPASLLLNGGQSATDTPATDQALSATNTGVADTYLWSITPNTINTRKQDGSRGDVERVTFSSTNTLNTTATFKYEGEYTVSFTASCGSSSVTKTADISVKAGRLFIAGPLFNGGSSSWATTATLSKDGNDQYTYQWNVNTSYTNQFAINGKDSEGNNDERRLYVVTNYADMDLTNLSMESGDGTNHNLSISNLSYNNGDEMTLTIEYTGMDNSTKKPKYSVSVTACSTHPVATTGTATGIGLQGATLPITISSSASGTCTPTKVGVKLYTSSTCDEEVSGYTFDEATWTTDQAYNIVVSGLSPGNTYYYRGYVKSSLGTNEDTSTSPVKSFRTTACTAPNVTAISNNSQTKCKGVAASQMELTVEGGVTPYSYAWKQNDSKSTTGATGATGSSNLASYTPPTSTAGTMYYYCVVSSATPCSSSQFSPSSDSDYATIVTNEVPSLSVVPTGTVKNFTPVTITSSNVNINSWSSSPAANDQTVYFYDNAAKSVKFKATVARSSNQTYTITATTAANCSANTSVTVTKDTETCE